MTTDLSSHLDSCYSALGFSTAPFQITPDTGFLVPQRQYLEAIGHLRYGMATGSFTLLTGDVGLGKTLLCRYLMQQLPRNVRTAYVFNPQQSYTELLASIIYDLTGNLVRGKTSAARLHDRLFNELAQLAGRGIRVALLIDEAHRLPAELLEGLRMLSNLETGQRKLISLLLVGQNELEQTLQAPEMRALRQRISVWHRLRPFTQRESREYIEHRLRIASTEQPMAITAHASWVAHRKSNGVPRRLNQICDRALMAAYMSDSHTLNARLMRRAAREVTALDRL